MGVGRAIAFLFILSTAPFVSATDPLMGPACVAPGVCIGAGMCVADAGCAPRSCQPAIHCRSNITLEGQDCEVNHTFEGRTCQTYVGGGFRTNQPGNDGWAAITITNGSVDLFRPDTINLENAWISPSADANLEIAGNDPGTISAGAYRSDIQGPDDGHAWAETAVFVRHDGGPTSGERVTIGVWTLDLIPEHCYARTSIQDIECPAAQELP